MSTLNVLLTHLRAEEVDEHLELLRAVAPDSRFVVCYGGQESQFQLIREREKAFVADASWRGPPRSYQSYNELFALLHDRWVHADPTLDAVFLFEFDHLILRADFERSLRDLAQRTAADLLAKACVPVNNTNWYHYTRFRRDTRLLEHLRSVSVRDDPARMFGMLASGLWLSREALESYVAVAHHPRCYGELYVPTLLYHLGHHVVDVDAVSRLYDSVRWEPDFATPEVARLRREGATFVHPVKDSAVRRQALATSA